MALGCWLWGGSREGLDEQTEAQRLSYKVPKSLCLGMKLSSSSHPLLGSWVSGST